MVLVTLSPPFINPWIKQGKGVMHILSMFYSLLLFSFALSLHSPISSFFGEVCDVTIRRFALVEH